MDYAVLLNPGHNRVYFESSKGLSLAELNIAAARLSSVLKAAQCESLSGVDYLTFSTEAALTEADAELIFGLSFCYALFELDRRDGGVWLRPIGRAGGAFIDESLSTLLKYTGKTNELFTRLMINVAVCSQPNRESIRLLDPLMGKGTTLYEGLIKGYNVYGVEIGDSAVNEAFHFVKRFLEGARYKFTSSTLRLSGPNKSFQALRHSFETAPTKADFAAKKTRAVELIAGNSMYTDKYYKKGFFDVLVADLPYGVQHGSVTNEKQSSLTRNPTELLRACLPAWREVLKPGGAMALAWNVYVLPRERLEQLIEAAGFRVRREPAYLQLGHRVDQAIVRDVLVAVK